MTKTIPPEVLSVLTRSTITERNLTLPPGQLDRKLYVSVNDVLTNAGGKWDRKSKSHVFQSDPREILGIALETGSIKDLVSEKQQYQAFFTPPWLAARVALEADVTGQSVLEPSAGKGALADACQALSAKSVSCIELNPEYANYLRDRHYPVINCDFLSRSSYPVFDRIVMNPPFTKNQDVKHVAHAIQFVRPGGRLVAIMAGNIDRPFFKTLQLDHTIEFLPPGSFKESGTNVNTILLSINV